MTEKKDLIEINENNTFYSLKFLACICVIIIHRGFTGTIGSIIKLFARWAVPFFFMLSGYYSNRNEDTDLMIKKRLKKTFKLLFFSLALYFMIYMLVILKNNDFTNYWLKVSSKKNIVFLMLLNNTYPFVGTEHLWYLLAIAYVYILFKFISKHHLFKYSLFFSVFSIIAVYIVEIVNYHFNLKIPVFYYRNFLFIGFPFFMIGNWIFNNQKIFVMKEDKRRLFCMLSFLLIIIVTIVEFCLFNDKLELYLSSALICFFFFIYAINNDKIKFGSKIGKMDSGNIFIFHFVIIMIDKYFIKFNVNRNLIPFIVFAVTLFLSKEYRILKMKICNRRYKNECGSKNSCINTVL